MIHLYPIPDAEGLEKTKEFCREKLGRELTDGGLRGSDSVMRFV